MICPSKICKQEILDDSLYCDQCGVQILRCSKCGNPGTGRFCSKCGGPMVFKKIEASASKPLEDALQQSAPQPTAPIEVPQQTATVSAKTWVQPAATTPQGTQQPESAKTIVMPQAVKKLLLCHSDGWNMELIDGDILGRTHGNHTDRLGSISVISGTHAKITYTNGDWFIIDQKSTNKTYVGGVIAQNGVPVKLKNNDVVQLANIKFIVREI